MCVKFIRNLVDKIIGRILHLSFSHAMTETPIANTISQDKRKKKRGSLYSQKLKNLHIYFCPRSKEILRNTNDKSN